MHRSQGTRVAPPGRGRPDAATAGTAGTATATAASATAVAVAVAVVALVAALVVAVPLPPAGAAGAGAAAVGAASDPPVSGRVWAPVGSPAGGIHHNADRGSWGVSVGGPCTGTDASLCMLPFPDDYYTVADRAMPTGRRIDFPASALPRAVGQGAVDPAPWEANDGFSPGSVLLTHVPGLNLTTTGAATISDMGRSLRADSPVVLLDATTGQRWPTWSELDVTDPDPSSRLLMIHPTQDLTEGDHYVVALRDLRNAAGSTIAPAAAFASVLAGRDPRGLSAPYRAHLEGDLGLLRRAGVGRAGLYLVWDFTVISTADLTGPALAMRDQAFHQLGPAVPTYTVTSVIDDPADNPSLAREVEGTFSVPDFLTAASQPTGSVLHTDAAGVPTPMPGRSYTATFDCEIPKAATPAHPGRIGLYGHGLFGTAAEVYASSVPEFSDADDYVFCGTDWVGLDASSLSLASAVVSNFAEFPALVDHLMQSLLDFEFLGRLMDDRYGFAANPAFEAPDRRSLLDPSSGLVYYGNSEGGIMGGALVALSTDVHRAVLGVPGMDYAVLLDRSADFAPFLGSLQAAYPSRAVQQLGFDLIQMLWDRGEADGYAEQLTGGLPGTPHHQVLLAEAFGDHQVANIATETEARTIGAAVHQPALLAGRSNEAVPFWDLPAFVPGGTGPALFVWDSGVPPAPLTDQPPTAGPDPHDTTPRSLPAFWSQMNGFFTTGKVPDPCGTAACEAPYP